MIEQISTEGEVIRPILGNKGTWIFLVLVHFTLPHPFLCIFVLSVAFSPEPCHFWFLIGS